MKERKTAIALGVFDGVHIGHRRLIHELCLDAAMYGLETLAFTFSRNPVALLHPDVLPGELMSAAEKRRALQALCVQHVVIQEFDEAFSRIPAEAFLRRLMEEYGMRHLVVGHDARIGYKGQGDVPYLRVASARMGFTLRVVPPVLRGGLPVSSTRARRALQQGQLLELRRMGIRYTLSGDIIHGKALGRTLGFPTMNVDFPREKALPPYGVYAAWTRVDAAWMPCIANLGIRPTVDADGRISLEVHALRDLPQVYGKSACVWLVRYLRPELRFSSVQELQAQIARDARTARECLPRLRLRGAKKPETYGREAGECV